MRCYVMDAQWTNRAEKVVITTFRTTKWVFCSLNKFLAHSCGKADWLCRLAIAWVPLAFHTVCETEDKPGWHGSTEHSATVDEDVFMTVWVGDVLSALPWPRAFDLVRTRDRTPLPWRHLAVFTVRFCKVALNQRHRKTTFWRHKVLSYLTLK